VRKSTPQMTGVPEKETKLRRTHACIYGSRSVYSSLIKSCIPMPRILLGIILFCILAYTIGYFKVRLQKPQKSDGTPKSAFEEGSRILVLMIGIGLLVFALFVVYTFGSYLLDKD
jgi:hypothetical protein